MVQVMTGRWCFWQQHVHHYSPSVNQPVTHEEIEGTLDNVFNKAFHAAQQHIDEAEAELTEELQREEAEAAEVATTKDMLQRMMSNLMQATQQINQAGASGASDHGNGDGS
eukprot:TRINITY_DN3050_c0_g1_i1.p5 TRINITY_DN3050_c0_g1~~TRINITY_DN3050_c0_g1_i1.p5  ORF type:complete len:111 (+),score=47.05 TRINITY_DN3050_c0_g1_i1:538-870(+)